MSNLNLAELLMISTMPGTALCVIAILSSYPATSLITVRAMHNQFWEIAPERLGDMATPADRLMGQKQFGKLLRREVVPLSRLAIGPLESREMIEMMKRSKALPAIHTALSFIPVRNNVP
jgi:hypothetical protein